MNLENIHFDGEEKRLPAPQNNVSAIPQPGTPGYSAWLAADTANRARFASGTNTQRLATIAADKKAAEESRAKHGTA